MNKQDSSSTNDVSPQLNYRAIHKALRDSNPRMSYKCRRKVIDMMEIVVFVRYIAGLKGHIRISRADE